MINANGHVDASIREKVQAAMEELGYVPNSVAQSLRQLRSRTIGITTSDLRVSYFPQIVSALDSVYMRSSQNSQPNSDTSDVNSRKER